MTAEARFWERVDASGDCWVWTARTDQRGYGTFGNYRAHRFAYEALVGPIPDGLTLDHLCRNTSCVNPDHLDPVTSAENTLRGVGPTARNARKTHCKNGHPLADNAYVRPIDGGTPWRCCRACKNARQNAARAIARLAA